MARFSLIVQDMQAGGGSPAESPSELAAAALGSAGHGAQAIDDLAAGTC
jgi:hypothetical protein